MKAFAVVAAFTGLALVMAGVGIAQLIPQQQAPAIAVQQRSSAPGRTGQARAADARLYAARRVHERNAGLGNW
jgi:hypothetical protein